MMEEQSSDSQNTNIPMEMDVDVHDEKSCQDDKALSSSQALECADQPSSSHHQESVKKCSQNSLQESEEKPLSCLAAESSEKMSLGVLSERTETPSSNGLQECLDSNTASCSSASTSLDGFQNVDSQINEEPMPVMDYDSIGEFCFESDHLALKGNSDYKKLLQVIVILEAKRAKAIKDLEKLIEMQEIALADPVKFVERLQNKEDLGLPGPQSIPALPVIDWNKYAISGSSSAYARRQNTRLAARANADLYRPSILETLIKGKSLGTSTTRGKYPEESKPATFNLPWTSEEQRKLEELLIQYPPEEIESRRWEKIANALGNRTPTQVASRVQKYFIKLTKAGIPVPGRAPNISHLRKPRRQVIRQHPSTFLVSQTPTVYMMEDDEDFSSNYAHSLPGSIDENSSDARIDLSDDDEISPELKDTPEYKEYVTLKKILQERMTSSGLAQHVGYQCNRCGCEPIIGIRWHCTDCGPSKSIDFCEDCVDCNHESGRHTADHHLEPVHQASTTFDKDYMHFLGSDYNYLDPNYMPAA